MNEIIERVARAICRSDGFDPDPLVPEWPSRGHAAFEDYLSNARAAIEAMREPTLAMIHHGARAAMREPWHGTELAIWQAMIDEALK